MWELCTKNQAATNCHHYSLECDKASVSFGEALSLLRDSENFRRFFIEFLQGLPVATYRWETPAYSKGLINRQFEFVILNSPTLERPANPDAFRKNIETKKESIVLFQNLGKDAHLIVSTCTNASVNYCHLGSFTRTAPYEQQQDLWALVGKTGSELISDKPVWLSTAGGGVPWLHIRFDTYPKYYGHAEFKKGG